MMEFGFECSLNLQLITIRFNDCSSLPKNCESLKINLGKHYQLGLGTHKQPFQNQLFPVTNTIQFSWMNCGCQT